MASEDLKCGAWVIWTILIILFEALKSPFIVIAKKSGQKKKVKQVWNTKKVSNSFKNEDVLILVELSL